MTGWKGSFGLLWRTLTSPNLGNRKKKMTTTKKAWANSRLKFSDLCVSALCVGHEEDIYPANGRPPKTVQKKLCPQCPVRQQCLDWALSSPYEPYGVWGGLGQDEVRAMWFSRHPGSRAG